MRRPRRKVMPLQDGHFATQGEVWVRSVTSIGEASASLAAKGFISCGAVYGCADLGELLQQPEPSAVR